MLPLLDNGMFRLHCLKVSTLSSGSLLGSAERYNVEVGRNDCFETRPKEPRATSLKAAMMNTCGWTAETQEHVPCQVKI